MMFFTHNSHHEVAPRVRSEFVGVYVAFSLDRNTGMSDSSSLQFGQFSLRAQASRAFGASKCFCAAKTLSTGKFTLPVEG